MILTEQRILELAQKALDRNGLTTKGWRVEIVDFIDIGDSGDGAFGFTDIGASTIRLARCWVKDTYPENIHELIRHEVAHALCGHGDHNQEWWDKLISLGGHGVWFWENGDQTIFKVA